MCENNFEQKVLESLSRCCGVSEIDLRKLKIGAAVSGGADSVSMLYALSHIFAHVEVITVNHNIRPVEETWGDAEFVRELCGELGNCFCTVVELPRGEVERVSCTRGGGIEEAARFLRYSAFEKIIDEKKLDYLCLAHNKNDQIETILMRFLSGASVEASGGIAAVRGKFVRPLLEISREEIESYLINSGYKWRTDSTNADPSYFRNNIRHNLLPVLNKNFPSFQPAILASAQKIQRDADFISCEVDAAYRKLTAGRDGAVGMDEISFSLSAFSCLPPALKPRILLKACTEVSSESRIPSAFLDDFCANPREVFFKSIQFSVKKDTIFIKKHVKTHTELVFSDIIKDEGNYNFPFGFLCVSNVRQKKEIACKVADFIFNEDVILHDIPLPCCVRSSLCDDEIECADKSMKKICEIFQNWHVPALTKPLIPIVQKLAGKNQEIVCIVGKVCGFENWVVKEE